MGIYQLEDDELNSRNLLYETELCDVEKKGIVQLK